MEHNFAGNSALTLEPAALHFHMTGFHGSLRLVCSVLEDCCLA